MRKVVLGIAALFIVAIANATPLVAALLTAPLPAGTNVPQPGPLVVFGVAVLALGWLLRDRRRSGR